MNQSLCAADVCAAQEEFQEEILQHGLDRRVWIHIDHTLQSHHFL